MPQHFQYLSICILVSSDKRLMPAAGCCKLIFIFARCKDNKIIDHMSSSARVLQALLEENPNHKDIKQTLKLMTQTREKVTYHAMVSSSETYLHVRGLANHNYDEFNYINKLLHSKIMGVGARIKRQEITVQDRNQDYEDMMRQRQRQENEITTQLAAQVEHVINNIDLPISLFKRDDKYWYPENPKTIQAKNYVLERMKQDKQRKRKIRSEIKKRQTEQETMRRNEIQKYQKLEQERRKKQQEMIKQKIQSLKKATEERSKALKESEKLGSSLKPLFKKIETEEHKKNTSALEEYKQKLSEIRKMHKSIDMAEISEHSQKVMKMKLEREEKSIINNPLKVSYKSKYHTSMTARSRLSEYDTNKSLYERKKEYGTMVKQEFKPVINEDLVREMEERLMIMARKRTRKNPKKSAKNSGDQDESEEQQEEKPPTPEPEPSEEEEEDSDRQPVPRDPDEDLDRKQRYKLGVNYLEYVRALPKKKNKSQPKSEKQEQESSAKGEPKAHTSSRYKDYLRDFVRTNRTTIDHIDTSKMKRDYNKSIISKDFELLNNLESQARKVENKIKNEEQLLKYRKLKDHEAMQKKVQIDNAVVDTIKARLAMMG